MTQYALSFLSFFLKNIDFLVLLNQIYQTACTVQSCICLQTQIILKVSRGILTVTNFLLRVSTKILTVKKPNKAILTMINCLLQISTALLISIFWCLHIWNLTILWVSIGVLCTITPLLLPPH